MSLAPKQLAQLENLERRVIKYVIDNSGERGVEMRWMIEVLKQYEERGSQIGVRDAVLQLLGDGIVYWDWDMHLYHKDDPRGLANSPGHE